MSVITQTYEQLVAMIIRPPRIEYELSDLGPPTFRIGPLEYKREDIDLKNPRGHTLKCSHYFLNTPGMDSEKRPCVIYCHGNSGCRLDALEAVKILIPLCSVFCFDFSGCGLSDGEYVSLGSHEQQDLATVVKYLRSTGKVSRIGLWGRSAVTSIMYASQDPSISGMVLDSPFCSLKRLCEELSTKIQFKIPKIMVSVGLKILRSSIKKRAKFDIETLETIKFVPKCFIPAVFAHGKEDDFVIPKHSQDLYNKYAGDKNILMVDGDHNSIRPDFMYDSVAIFFHNVLFEKGEKPPTAYDIMNQKPKHEVPHIHLDTLPKQDLNAYHFENSDFGEVVAIGAQDEEDEMIRRAIEESLKTAQEELKAEEIENSTKSTPTSIPVEKKEELTSLYDIPDDEDSSLSRPKTKNNEKDEKSEESDPLITF